MIDVRPAARRTRSIAAAMTVAPDWVMRTYRGTDKQVHGYLPYYRTHCGPLRFRRMTVFEIGVGGYESATTGGSLALWRDFFPRATIVGLDISPKTVAFGPRVKFAQADQSSPSDLQAVVDRDGRPTVVIDDGSHVGEHIHASFRFLWPLLPAGGVYVVEDLCTSYQAAWGGGRPTPPPTSGIGLLQCLLSDVQAQDPSFTLPDLGSGAPPDALYEQVSAVHVYPGIAFIAKL